MTEQKKQKTKKAKLWMFARLSTTIKDANGNLRPRPANPGKTPEKLRKLAIKKQNALLGKMKREKARQYHQRLAIRRRRAHNKRH